MFNLGHTEFEEILTSAEMFNSSWLYWSLV